MDTSNFKKYTIDRSDDKIIRITDGTDEITLTGNNDTVNVIDCYEIIFSEMDDGSIIEYTELNGVSSELVIPKDKIDENNLFVTNDVQFDKEYIYMNIEFLETKKQYPAFFDFNTELNKKKNKE
jgi:hypothetical protein